MLELRGVEKRYGETHAVGPIDLSIAVGRTTVLIGPSGSGKSTLLRLVLGLLPVSAGTILFDDRPIEPFRMQTLRLRVGYVVQDGGLFPHLTARANATIMARYLGWSGERIDRRLDELCAMARLEPAQLDRFPAELSGGQRQRVSLLRALMLDPEILLLDEPLGALDAMIRHDLQQDLRDVFTTLGKTVVLVTHDLAEAAFFADTLVLLDCGRIVQSGTLDSFAARPAAPFVTRFINAQRGPFDRR